MTDKQYQPVANQNWYSVSKFMAEVFSSCEDKTNRIGVPFENEKKFFFFFKNLMNIVNVLKSRQVWDMQKMQILLKFMKK